MSHSTMPVEEILDRPYDIEKIRRDFPTLETPIYKTSLTYLDSGATALKPKVVTDRLYHLSTYENASVHRGVHFLSAQMTAHYEESRAILANFLGASSPEEIVFTANATDSFNLMAQSWGRTHLKKGDAILLSEMEHHANIVPWQLLAQEIGFDILVIPILDDGSLDLESFDRLLTERVKLVSITHASNVLGTIPPVEYIIKQAHKLGATTLLDGSQACVHLPVNVQTLDVDFYIGTGHKLYGPTGIGFLFGKAQLLDKMPPWKGGGDMIDSVSFDGTTYKEAPARFEAGTPPYLQAIGLAEAIKYLQEIGMAQIHAYEQTLYQQSLDLLSSVEGFTLYGQSPEKSCLFSFNLDGIHPHDVAAILDRCGVAVRVGHHCAEPLMHRLGTSATLRASYGLYNNLSDTEKLVEGLQMARRLFG